MQAGRKTKNFNPYATVDWMAYQGAPVEGMAGVIKIQKWWSGTNCADMTFPKVGSCVNKRAVPPSAYHLQLNIKSFLFIGPVLFNPGQV